jgi:putative nucleotidyltransferase with HDIG domain
MKTLATPSDSIDVQALCVGMYVHLDTGWMGHPFPLSSFKITSAAQIDTIRSLGLKRVRWSPQQSEPEAVAAAPSAAEPVQTQAEQPAESGPEPKPVAAATAEGPVAPRSPLERQQEALRLAEQQFAEASKACRQLFDLVPAQPRQAGAQAGTLTRTLLQEMLGQQEVCIRLLTEGAGEQGAVHPLNVAIISLLMGRSFGFAEPDMEDLGVGALLHDIGKAELPPRLRHAASHFSLTERAVYEEHVLFGVELAQRMGLTPGATQVIAQHHEHADGSGFPHGLNTDRMSYAARIVALVNRYDNLCNPRLPADALTPHEALSLLFAQGQAQFDTAILGAFIRMMGVYPAGSAVQLTDDRYALVVAVNSSRPLKPGVLVHDPSVPREAALVLDLESAGGLGIRRSLRPQQLPSDALDYLAPRQRVAYYFEAVPPHDGATPA